MVHLLPVEGRQVSPSSEVNMEEASKWISLFIDQNDVASAGPPEVEDHCCSLLPMMVEHGAGCPPASSKPRQTGKGRDAFDASIRGPVADDRYPLRDYQHLSLPAGQGCHPNTSLVAWRKGE